MTHYLAMEYDDSVYLVEAIEVHSCVYWCTILGPEYSSYEAVSLEDIYKGFKQTMDLKMVQPIAEVQGIKPLIGRYD